jgi:hypothetical protein
MLPRSCQLISRPSPPSGYIDGNNSVEEAECAF